MTENKLNGHENVETGTLSTEFQSLRFQVRTISGMSFQDMASQYVAYEGALGGRQSRQWGWSRDQEAGSSSSWTLKSIQESGRW